MARIPADVNSYDWLLMECETDEGGTEYAKRTLTQLAVGGLARSDHSRDRRDPRAVLRRVLLLQPGHVELNAKRPHREGPIEATGSHYISVFIYWQVDIGKEPHDFFLIN